MAIALHKLRLQALLFLGLPATLLGQEARFASGTSWQPDSTPMYAVHEMTGGWMLMCHYNAFLSFDDQSGPRGAHQVNSENWFMGMAMRRLGEDEIEFHGMFTLEPWTVTDRGFPELFQTGEAYNGQPLVDRQHPHNFFMELSARYRHPIEKDAALSVYLAPVGEPALGPPVFMHRTSAMDDPEVPISHHWLDSTHVSFGVATLGLSRGPIQIEGSSFNGREPNQERWEFPAVHLDSYSGRVSWNPGREWSAQASFGYLASPEELSPREDEHRATASLMNVHPLPGGRVLATTLAFGQDRQLGRSSDAWLLESDWQATPLYTFFGRAEYVEKTGEELNLPPFDRVYDLPQLSLGATRELLSGRGIDLAVGAEATHTWPPGSLEALYGAHPVGFWLFLRIRPSRLRHPMSM